MKIQLLLVGLFALNVLIVWSAAKFIWLKWYNLPGSFVFTYLPLCGVFFSQPRFDLDHFWWIIAGFVAIVLGLGIIILSKMAQQKVFTNLGDEPTQLVVTGPYHFVRHPIYLGLIFVFVGWWWVWATVYSFYFGMLILLLIWLQALLEEKLVLEKKFGQDYAIYKKHTGMFWIK